MTTLTSISGASFQITAKATATLAVSGFENALTNSVSVTHGSSSITYSGTAPGCNTIVSKINTLSASATLNLDLSGSLADLCNQSSSTLTKIIGMIIALLPTGHSSGLGSAAASITIGGAASNEWVGLFVATGTLTLKNGAALAVYDPAGLTVTASTGDILKIVNDSGSASAYVQTTFFGIG